jgi:hypothetical protein
MTPSTCLKVSLWLSLCAAAVTAHGQGSSSPVIGYYKFNVPPGRSIWVCGLVTKTDFQGLATSVSSSPTTSTITTSGANWPGFSNHYVEILDGSWAGLALDILSSTATTVTVDGNLGSGAGGFNVPQNVKFAIRAHATLGKIFKGSNGGLSPFEDEINLFYDNGSTKRFYYDDSVAGGQILDAVTFANKDNERVYPGQGMLFVTSGPRTLTFGGGEVSYVKQTPTKVPLYGGRANLVGPINPIVATSPLVSTTANERAPLGSASFGLTTSGLSEFEDEISPYGLVGGVFSRQGIFYYDGFNSIVDLNGSPTSLNVPFGTGLVIKPAGDRYYTQPGVAVSN